MLRRTSLASVLALSLLAACDDTGSSGNQRGRETPSTAATRADAAASRASDASTDGAIATAPKRKNPADCKVPDAPTPIDFTDPVLEKAVKFALSIGHDGGVPDKVTKADLPTIKSLNMERYGSIKELDVCLLPLMTSLKELLFKGTDVEDLGPVESLTSLETLSATRTKVADLSALGKLQKLTRLDVSHTLVGDIQSLAMLPNLKEVIFDGDTSVSDLTPLSGLTKLEVVSIRDTAVSSVAPLAGLRMLKRVDLTNTPVGDLSPLSGQKTRGMKIIGK